MTSKDHLLHAARHINKMSGSSIEILREMQMLNLKLMERSSKCVKDPNPLASTMALMNKKYPLAIDRKLAKKYKIPQRFLADNGGNRGVTSDAHTHNRVLCKKDAIEWWISESEIPNEETVKIIDILYEQRRKQVETYYSIKWKFCGLKWGPPILERRLVRTNIPKISIPRHLREDVLKEALFKDFTIPNKYVTPELLEKVKELVQLSISSKMLLSRQIRILINSLDTADKYLPMLPSSSDEVVGFKHALYHNNYVVTNYELDSESQIDKIVNPLSAFVKCLIFESRISSLDKEAMLEIAGGTKIHGKPVDQIVREESLPNLLIFKWLKVLYGIPCDHQHTVGRLTVCPEPSLGTIVLKSNMRGVTKEWRINTEVIHFKFEALKGHFSHTSNSLSALTVNYTDITSLKELLKEIAVYIGWQWGSTTARNEQQALEEIRMMVQRSPWHFIGCSRREFSNIGLKSHYQESYGVMRINNNTEYISTQTYELSIDSSSNIYNPHTNQRIEVRVHKSDLKTFSEEINCTDTRMLNHFDFKRTLKNRVYYYIMNYSELRRRIREGDFIWKNQYLRKFMGANAKQISQLCRYSIQSLSSSETPCQPLIVLLYCFCHVNPEASCMSPTKFHLKTGHCVDLDAREGIFLYNQERERYELFGMKLRDNSSRLSRATIMNGIIFGYNLSTASHSNLPVRSYKYLEENHSRILDGTSFRTFICGSEYIATRDSSVGFQTQMTMNRQMREYFQSLQKQGRLIFGKGNDLVFEDSEEEEEPYQKRARVDESFLATGSEDEFGFSDSD